jgi:molybdopterin converting factor small subunit
MAPSTCVSQGERMKLEIVLFAGLVCDNPDLSCHGKKEFHQEFAMGITIRQLRDLLGINPALPLIVMVNNHGEPESFTVADGDRVALFPPIGGG